jgi:ribonuclease P protein component
VVIIILESIKKEVDIKRIFKEGAYINKKYFIIYMCYKESKVNKIRTRFIVTKKIGTAVVRNKIKRFLREILRLLNIVNFKEIEIIIIVKRNIKNIGFWDLDSEVRKVLKQI